MRTARGRGGGGGCGCGRDAIAPGLPRTAQRLRSTVAARRLGELAPPVTVTIGVAHCEPRSAGALHVALAYAEQALRRARKAGRDRVAAAPAALAATSGTRRAA